LKALQRATLAVGLLALGWMVGCTEDAPGDPTQTVVIVQAEAAVKQRAARLHVVVRSEDDDAIVRDELLLAASSADAGDATLVWPYVIALSPKDGDASRRFSVFAEAQDSAGQPITAVRAISGYVKHEQRSLTLTLQQACIGISCNDVETCQGGVCESAEVPVSELAPFDPKTDAPPSVPAVVDGSKPDAATALDASLDAALDSGGDTGPITDCIPNPDPNIETCPLICPESCNGEDDDCDRQIDENGDDGCQLEHTEASCVQGSCVTVQCLDGYRDCDLSEPDGCESPPDDLLNCGACGNACDYANAEALCVQGRCVQAACAPLYGDCDGDRQSCEVPLDTLTDCGQCGKECEDVPHAVPSCAGGSCGIDACLEGYGDCDGSAPNGCEQELATLTHCGGCNQHCDFPGSTGDDCALKTCLAGTCQSGYADCDGDPSDGCESLSSATHCGQCQAKCDASLMNVADATCGGAGSCSITACDPGFGNCDANALNGCEASVRTLSNCGSCGTGCAIAHAVTSCATGSCNFVNCQNGWGDCSNGLADGCEQALNTATNCGACGMNCANVPGKPYCSGGQCVSVVCPGTTADCDGLNSTCEVDLASNASSCGACGNLCSFSTGTPHASGLTCQSAACKPSCDAGYADCNGNYADGCETSLRTLTDCGSCGTGCAIANATATCGSGVCEVASCAAGLGNCDANATDCETSLDTTSNCGGCGVLCNLSHAVEACEGPADARTCGVTTCESGWGDCDGLDSSGCEASLTTPTNCGGCASAAQNQTCENLPNVTQTSCGSGSCAIAQCAADWVDCDADVQNGCEQQLSVVGPCLPDSDCVKHTYGGRSYFVCSNPRTWSAARTQCQTQLLGDLVRIDDQAENDFVLSKASASAWIGATDASVEGTWRWIDNAAQFWSGPAAGNSVGGLFGKWAAGEPNDSGGNEDCGVLQAPGGTWTDLACGGTRGFVCEVQADLCPNDPKANPGQCGCSVADTDGDGDGTANCNDACPSDPNKTAAGACGCGVGDADNDGTEDCAETCPNDPNKLAPGVCGCGTSDANTDGDAQLDCIETCDSDPNKLVPGACGCGVADTNTDGDSLADCNEACDADPLKLLPGVCGCGTSDVDDDTDGTPNCNDGCPSHAIKTAPGLCGCATLDTNTDGDSQPDCNETCDADPLKLDPGVCDCGTPDDDTDGDGALDCSETCPADPDKLEPGLCGCGVSDDDSDGDGAADCMDGCPGDASKLDSCYEYTPSNFDDSTLFGGEPDVDASCGGTIVLSTSSESVVSICGTEVTPVVQAQSGGPELWILPLASLNVAAGTTLRFTGSRPAVLAVAGDATISGRVDANAVATAAGAGGNVSCAAGAGIGGNGGAKSGANAGGGGGGGGFVTAGAAGGTGYSGVAAGAAGAVGANTTLTPLRGGCPGGGGGGATAGSGGVGGGGGGALQLSVAGTLELTSGAIVSAAGGGGARTTTAQYGGGGGGSGGGVLLEGQVLNVSQAAWVTANGGGGAGGNDNSSGTAGTDGYANNTASAPGGAGGGLYAGDGGNGASAAGTAAAGQNGTGLLVFSNGGGGGGGGSLGRVRLRAASTNPGAWTASNFTPASYTYVRDVVINCNATFNSLGATPSFTTWCSGTQPTPVVITQASGPSVVVVPMKTFQVASGFTLKVIGDKPVIFAVDDTASVAGTIDASAYTVTPGAGGNWSGCGPGTANGQGANGSHDTTGDDGSGGGGGGGFYTTGGSGGAGHSADAGNGGGGGASVAPMFLTPLRGGCRGGNGGAMGGTTAGAGGGGIQVSARNSLLVSGVIDVSGGGGAACAAAEDGGGGGGSAGSILLESYNIAATGLLRATGGGGSRGCRSSAATGLAGTDGRLGGAGAVAATGGGAGGAGRTPGLAGAVGSAGTFYTYQSGTDSNGNPIFITENGAGGGGGGGAGGRVIVTASAP
jgi:hypothetical protein